MKSYKKLLSIILALVFVFSNVTTTVSVVAGETPEEYEVYAEPEDAGTPAVPEQTVADPAPVVTEVPPVEPEPAPADPAPETPVQDGETEKDPAAPAQPEGQPAAETPDGTQNAPVSSETAGTDTTTDPQPSATSQPSAGDADASVTEGTDGQNTVSGSQDTAAVVTDLTEGSGTADASGTAGTSDAANTDETSVSGTDNAGQTQDDPETDVQSGKPIKTSVVNAASDAGEDTQTAQPEQTADTTATSDTAAAGQPAQPEQTPETPDQAATEQTEPAVQEPITYPAVTLEAEINELYSDRRVKVKVELPEGSVPKGTRLEIKEIDISDWLINTTAKELKKKIENMWTFYIAFFNASDERVYPAGEVKLTVEIPGMDKNEYEDEDKALVIFDRDTKPYEIVRNDVNKLEIKDEKLTINTGNFYDYASYVIAVAREAEPETTTVNAQEQTSPAAEPAVEEGSDDESEDVEPSGEDLDDEEDEVEEETTEEPTTEEPTTTQPETTTEEETTTQAERTRTEYIYEDAYVLVTAVLQDPKAVPDDAELQVTPIYPNSTDYNYDAYMKALNDAHVDEYTSQNTLLYDIAFMVPDRDEKGNALGTSHEFEPEQGSVTVSLKFKQRQLTQSIDTKKAGNVELIHLEADKQLDPATINDWQISPQNLDANVSISGSETVKFDTDSFSVYAFSNVPEEEASISVDLSNYLAEGREKYPYVNRYNDTTDYILFTDLLAYVQAGSAVDDPRVIVRANDKTYTDLSYIFSKGFAVNSNSRENGLDIYNNEAIVLTRDMQDGTVVLSNERATLTIKVRVTSPFSLNAVTGYYDVDQESVDISFVDISSIYQTKSGAKSKAGFRGSLNTLSADANASAATAPASDGAGAAQPAGESVSGAVGLNISVNVPSDGIERTYSVPVSLSQPIDMLSEIGADRQDIVIDNADIALYHVVDGQEVPVQSDFSCTEDGKITDFTFLTDSFSPYIIRYTVDFHYKGVDYSIPGNSQILLSQLIGILNIMNGEDLLDVADVADVQFSDEHLVEVSRVSGVITYNNGDENVTADVGEKDFLLSSVEAFTSEEKLTITLVNGEIIEVGVTDASLVMDIGDNDSLKLSTILKTVDDESSLETLGEFLDYGYYYVIPVLYDANGEYIGDYGGPYNPSRYYDLEIEDLDKIAYQTYGKLILLQYYTDPSVSYGYSSSYVTFKSGQKTIFLYQNVQPKKAIDDGIFTYKIKDGNAEITGLSSTYTGNGEIVIPGTVTLTDDAGKTETYIITKICKEAFYNETRIKTVTFANTDVIELESLAFFYLPNLTSINGSGSVRLAANSNSPINQNDKLKSVELHIEGQISSFINYCQSLENVTIYNTNGSDIRLSSSTFNNCKAIRTIELHGNVTYISALNFYNSLPALESVLIDSAGKTDIGNNAFVGISSLLSVTFTGRVGKINQDAFIDIGNGSGTVINLNDGVDTIITGAFDNIAGPVVVNISEGGSTTVERNSFADNSNLTVNFALYKREVSGTEYLDELTLTKVTYLDEEDLIEYDDGTFIYSVEPAKNNATVVGFSENYNGDASVIIPAAFSITDNEGKEKTISVKAIAENAFMGTTNKTFTVSGDIEVKGSFVNDGYDSTGAFAYCQDCTFIFQGNNTFLGESAFQGCSNIDVYATGNGSIDLGKKAFAFVNGLDLRIGNGVNVTGSEINVFQSASGTLEFLGGVSSIGGYSFIDNSFSKLTTTLKDSYSWYDYGLDGRNKMEVVLKARSGDSIRWSKWNIANKLIVDFDSAVNRASGFGSLGNNGTVAVEINFNGGVGFVPAGTFDYFKGAQGSIINVYGDSCEVESGSFPDDENLTVYFDMHKRNVKGSDALDGLTKTTVRYKDSGYHDNTFFYDLTETDGEVTAAVITGIYNKEAAAVTISSTTDNEDHYPVTGFGANALKDNKVITSIEFVNDQPFEVSGGALQNMSALQTIQLNGTGLVSFGKTDWERPFRYCSSLTSVTGTGPVSFNAMGIFEGCSSLKEVKLGAVSKLNQNTFIDNKALISFEAESVTGEIGYQAFNRCDALKSVVINGDVGTIQSWAFDGCTAMDKIVVLGKVTKICQSAFTSPVLRVAVFNEVGSMDYYAFNSSAFSQDNQMVYIGRISSASNYSFGSQSNAVVWFNMTWNELYDKGLNNLKVKRKNYSDKNANPDLYISVGGYGDEGTQQYPCVSFDSAMVDMYYATDDVDAFKKACEAAGVENYNLAFTGNVTSEFDGFTLHVMPGNAGRSSAPDTNVDFPADMYGSFLENRTGLSDAPSTFGFIKAIVFEAGLETINIPDRAMSKFPNLASVEILNNDAVMTIGQDAFKGTKVNNNCNAKQIVKSNAGIVTFEKGVNAPLGTQLVITDGVDDTESNEIVISAAKAQNMFTGVDNNNIRVKYFDLSLKAPNGSEVNDVQCSLEITQKLRQFTGQDTVAPNEFGFFHINGENVEFATGDFTANRSAGTITYAFDASGFSPYAAAYTVNIQEVEGIYKYVVDGEGNATIIGYGPKFTGSILDIPAMSEEIDGKTYKVIGISAGALKDQPKNITIKSVKFNNTDPIIVNSGAMSGINTIESIYFDGTGNVEFEDGTVFEGSGTASLTVSMPNGLTALSRDGNISAVFSKINGTYDLEIDNISAIPARAFSNDTKVRSVTVKSALKDKAAFNPYTSYYPYRSDFANAAIGQGAFEGATALESFIVESSSGSSFVIGNEAFYGCTSLRTLSAADRICGIGESALRGTAFTDLTIQTDTLYLGDYSLADCSNLSSLTINGNAIPFGDYALGGGTLLNQLIINGKISQQMHSDAVRADNLELLIIRDGCGGFQGGTMYAEGIIKPVLTAYIGGTAQYCDDPYFTDDSFPTNKQLRIYFDLPNNQEDAWQSHSLRTAPNAVDIAYSADTAPSELYVDSSVSENAEQNGSKALPFSNTAKAFEATQKDYNIGERFKQYFTEAGYDPDNLPLKTENVQMSDYTLYIVGKTTEIDVSFAGQSGLTAIEIDTTTPVVIDNGAFKDCEKLTEVRFTRAAGLTIGEAAFSGDSKIEALYFGSKYAYENKNLGDLVINNSAFSGCSGITDLKVNTSGDVTVMAGAFNGCSKFEAIDVKGNNVVFGADAFKNASSLRSLEVTNNAGYATTIETGAFAGCEQLDSVLVLSSNPAVIKEGAFTENVDVLRLQAGASGVDNGAFSGGTSYVDESVTFSFSLPAKIGSFENIILTNAQSISSNAQVFGGNNNLKTVYLGKSTGVGNVGGEIFAGMPASAAAFVAHKQADYDDDKRPTREGGTIHFLDTEGGMYIDGTNPKGNPDGTRENGFKTFEQAKKYVENNNNIAATGASANNGYYYQDLEQILLNAFTTGKVTYNAKDLRFPVPQSNSGSAVFYVIGTVTVDETQTWNSNGLNKTIVLIRDEGFDGNLVKVPSGVDLTLENVVLDGAHIPAKNTLIYVEGGTLNINDGAVICNNNRTAGNGYPDKAGGIYAGNGGTVNLDGGTISGNTGTWGGGIQVCGSEFNMSEGVIENNSCESVNGSSGYGGGVHISFNATMNMSGGFIQNNQGNGYADIYSSNGTYLGPGGGAGGGIAVGGGAVVNGQPSILNMSGGTISNNSAMMNGGGVYIECESWGNFSGGSIEKNYCGNGVLGGGGIYVNGGRSGFKNGVAYLECPLITANHADQEGGGLAGCASSVTNVYAIGGGAVYGNYSSDGSDIYSETIIRPPTTYENKMEGYVSAFMYNGAAYNWRDSRTGEILTAAQLSDLRNLVRDNIVTLTAYPDGNQPTGSSLVIRNNASGTKGGGIGSNGSVIIGTPPEPQDVKWTPEVNKILYNRDMEEGEEFTFKVYEERSSVGMNIWWTEYENELVGTGKVTGGKNGQPQKIEFTEIDLGVCNVSDNRTFLIVEDTPAGNVRTSGKYLVISLTIVSGWDDEKNTEVLKAEVRKVEEGNLVNDIFEYDNIFNGNVSEDATPTNNFGRIRTEVSEAVFRNYAEDTSISVEKKWKWADADGTVHTDAPNGATVTFELYADGKPTGKTVKLDGVKEQGFYDTECWESEPWTATWKNLDAYRTDENGNVNHTTASTEDRIVYTVKEISNSHELTFAPVEDTVEVEDNKAEIINAQGSIIITKNVKVTLDNEVNDSVIEEVQKKEFNVEITTTIGDTLYYVIDREGQTVLSETPPAEPLTVSMEKDLKLSPLPAGTYTVKEIDPEDIGGLKLLEAESVTEATVKIDPDNLTAEAALENVYGNSRYCIAVTKNWDDENNRDGKRPENLYAELYRDGIKLEGIAKDAAGNKVDYVTLNAANNWTAMVRGVELSKGDGTWHEYTWQEFVFAADGETRVYPQPSGSGENAAVTITVSEGAVYTVKNEGVDTIEDSENGTITFITKITNKYEHETVTIKANKEWAGDYLEAAEGSGYDYRGMRSDVTFRLYGSYDIENEDGVKETYYILDTELNAPEQTISADAEAQYAVWTDLPVYWQGHKISYAVKEVAGPEGYSASYSKNDEMTEFGSASEQKLVQIPDSTTQELTIRNTLDTGSLVVSKNLFVNNEDVSDLQLYSDKTFYYTVSTKIGEDTYWITDKSVFSEEPYVFTIAPGTQGAQTFSALPVGLDYTVTEVKGTEDTTRIGTTIHSEDETAEIVTPTANIGGMSFVAPLSRTETTVHLGKSDDEGTMTALASLANVYVNGRYCIAVTKQWLINDKVSVPDDDQTLKVMLQRSVDGENWASAPLDLKTTETEYDAELGTIILTKENNWSAVAVGMDMTDENDKPYSYRWVEMDGDQVLNTGDKVDGWTVGEPELIQSAQKDETTLIFLTKLVNSKEIASVSVEKVWDDNDDKDHIRPEYVIVELLANDVTKDQAVLNEQTEWKHTFDDLPVRVKGEAVEYSVREIYVPEGYKAVVSGNSTDGYVITNIHSSDTTEATVMKVWADNDNEFGKRPETLTVNLTAVADGKELNIEGLTREYTMAPPEAEEGQDVNTNTWMLTVDGLPKFDDSGHEIEYTWTEGDVPEGYVLISSSKAGTVTTLVNTFNTETTSLTVQKRWIDGSNYDNSRPDSLSVKLTGTVEGENEGDAPIVVKEQTVELTEENQWTYTVENLPRTDEGRLVTYTWTEDSVPEGYRLTKTETTGTLTTITNTYGKVPTTEAMGVAKRWSDGRSTPVTFTLSGWIRNEDGSLQLHSTDSQTTTNYIWDSLPAYTEDYQPIFYYLEEEGVSEDGTTADGYISSITGNAVDGWIVTNHAEPEPVVVTNTETITETSKEIKFETKTETKETNTETTTNTETIINTETNTNTETDNTEQINTQTTETVDNTVTENNVTEEYVPTVPQYNPPQISTNQVTLVTPDTQPAEPDTTVPDQPAQPVIDNPEVPAEQFQEQLREESVPITEVITDTVYIYVQEQPQIRQLPRTLDIEDYGVPLGIDVMINHVGDCFD